MDDLLQWAKNHGTRIGDVSIGLSPTSGYFLQASNDIETNSGLISCSYQTMLSYLNVALGTTRSTEKFPLNCSSASETTKPHIMGHFFLMQQYLLQEKSFWYTYIRLLPQPNEPERFGIPILWPEEDQEFLAGTNLEPAIKKRAEMWKADWEEGISQIQNPREIKHYSYDLYQWAASIFGSRSFRASLTVAEDTINASNLPAEQKQILLQQVRDDQFSVLLPVLDLGNHNGVNEVQWHHAPDKGAFLILTTKSITKGSEIYNYYGDKSNSELLLAYGFTLPHMKHDLVNFKVTPSPAAQSLRRQQICHRIPKAGHEDEEFLYQVRLASPDDDTERPLVFQPFSHGLLDTMACMVATPREEHYLAEHTHTCYECSISDSQLPLFRNTIQILFILKAKLLQEITRIVDYPVALSFPQNQNQRIALAYRESQRRILVEALKPIAEMLPTVVKEPREIEIGGNEFDVVTHQILSLDEAFFELGRDYDEVAAVEQMIADDQDEKLPLDWSALVADWDHTYWIVFVFLLLLLREKDGHESFTILHMHESRSWSSFLFDMKFGDTTTNTLYAEPSEQETIDFMTEGILQLPQFEAIRSRWSKEEYIQWRNFASYIFMENSIQGHADDVPQELLCISSEAFDSEEDVWDRKNSKWVPLSAVPAGVVVERHQGWRRYDGAFGHASP